MRRTTIIVGVCLLVPLLYVPCVTQNGFHGINHFYTFAFNVSGAVDVPRLLLGIAVAGVVGGLLSAMSNRTAVGTVGIASALLMMLAGVYAQRATIDRAEADERWAWQLLHQGRLTEAKQQFANAAKNWNYALYFNEAKRLNGLASSTPP